MNKIKVGFEITDIWKNGDFRQFIQKLLRDDRFELYLVSNNDISAYILSVGEVLQLPTSRVFIVNFTQDKIQKIVDLKLDIYLETLKYVADQIENTTDCHGIYVNELPITYYVQPGYIVQFNRVVSEINKENCEELKEE